MELVNKRVVLTGFMGVGKSTVARHLSYLTKSKKIDLDDFIEQTEKRRIPEIIESDGMDFFRQVETKRLAQILAKTDAKVISLGGGAWTTLENRELIKQCECVSVWLESTFDHCWRNIIFSKRNRPLIKNKKSAQQLFEERRNYYCLADWHFVINPGHNSFEVAKQIAQEIFQAEIN